MQANSTKQGPVGPQGPPGVAGPRGAGDLSLCEYKSEFSEIDMTGPEFRLQAHSRPVIAKKVGI